MGKKLLLGLALCWSLSAAWAQDLLMAVSEGTSGGLDHARVIAKYQGLADAIGRSLRRKVSVIFAREFAQLEQGMRTQRFDLVLARPSDYPARAVRQYGYQFLASARPDGQCWLLAGPGAGVRSLADIRGKRIVLPEPAAYMTRFCAAELRDQGIDLAREKVQYVREQGAVVFYLEHGLADVGGVASYSGVASGWLKQGRAVLHRSRQQPYFPLVAGPRLSDEERAAVRKALAALPQEATGQAVLRTIGIDAFDLDSEPRLRELLDWMGT